MSYQLLLKRVLHQKKRHTLFAIVTSGLILSGCMGEQTGNDGQSNSSSHALSAGPMPLRRLNLKEYDNTIRELLKLDLDVEPSITYQFAADINAGEFKFPAVTQSASPFEVRKYEEAAAALSQQVDISAIFSCPSALNNTVQCAENFVESFGLKAYRRPLNQTEISGLMDLYHGGRDVPLNLSHNEALQLVVQAIIQSPNFLYRWESGQTAPTMENGLVRLNSYEVASRLSYFLWRSMPDDQLFQLAAADGLTSKDAVATQARRMLADEKAREPLIAFFEYWLGYDDLLNINKDDDVYPEFDLSLKRAMLEESRTFVENIVFNGDRQFESLLTSANTVVNSDLADLYGSNFFGDNWISTQLNPSERGGLLTLAAFLADKGAANGSNPALRGAIIYEQMLCGHLPPPPNVIPAIDPPSAGGTTRDRFETHTSNPCASACHALFDPLGFAFESYDGIGQFRRFDNNSPVNSASEIELDGRVHAFDDAMGLSEIMASSTKVKSCFTRQWMRFALDRNEVGDLDEPSIEQVTDSFIRSGDIQDLIVSIATSDSFLYRSPSSGEEIE